MKKNLGMVMMLLISTCLLAGCNGIKDVQAPESPAQTETSISENQNAGEDITPESFLDQILVENISPYEGIFLEGEEKERVEDTYALKVTNVSEETILYATFTFHDGKQELTFYMEMIPKGKTVLVAEQNKREHVSDKLNYVDGEIHYLREGLEKMESVKITPTDLSTLNVKNMTKEPMPVVWIFYRKAETDGTLLGGKCYETGILDLGARETYEAEAEYWMDDCEIVNVLLIDSLDSLKTEEKPMQGIEEEVTSNP